jgi:hypothetical protein
MRQKRLANRPRDVRTIEPLLGEHELDLVGQLVRDPQRGIPKLGTDRRRTITMIVPIMGG